MIVNKKNVKLYKLQHQAKILLTIENSCNKFNYDNNEFKKVSHYIKYQHVWNKLSNKQKQVIISKYIDNIIIDNTNKKDLTIKSINIKENMLAEISYKFRYGIFLECLTPQEQDIIKEQYTYEPNKLINYYNIKVDTFKGACVDIDYTLENLILGSAEENYELITL